MHLHYLKLAFRNMRKYKNQTLISVIGLAMGFTCFALAMLWIRYEMTFDSFHKNAKQMYVVYSPSSSSQTGYSSSTSRPLALYLKETFPEIANATSASASNDERNVFVEGIEIMVLMRWVDSSFLSTFDVKIVEGSPDFLLPGNFKIAITQEKARQLFGNELPIGKIVNLGREYTICAVVSGMSKQSNYPFDFLCGVFPSPDLWDAVYYSSPINTIIELLPGTNIKAFEKKLYEHNTGEGRGNISGMTIIPLTKLHYTDPNIVREVSFQHILIFALSGLLVILCSLFNYLTLFMSRFKIRQKELALRMVCGASGRSLLTMLSVEFLLTLLFAVVLGCCLTQLVFRDFLTLSKIQMNLSAIYSESLIYIGSIILVSMFAFWLILFIFQRRSLNVSIRQGNKNMFRKISVILQLVISIGFAFCSIIILKQMYFLHNSTELGFSFKNRGSVMIWTESGGDDVLAHLLKQIPEITEVIYARGIQRLLPYRNSPSHEIRSWDDKPFDSENISLERSYVSPDFIAFYELQLISGEMLTDYDPESMILLNESAVNAFGWHDPVGKQFDDRYTVKGVIKNVYNNSPTVNSKPVFYLKSPPGAATSMMSGTTPGQEVKNPVGNLVLFKYREGMWKSCMKKIEQIINENDINGLRNDEEEYNKYLKSENALIKLLSFVSAICVLICVFGFVSLVSITCEERRKEIAIRKINGATAGDILAMFAKEYFLLLLIGAIIAFTTGYFIMQRWLEQYVKQTSIPAWIYLSIVFVLALVIVLCVGWQVYRASIENPAEVVKSE